jgi:predicted  nucleic acid-binding Zn-ribbon protein
MSESRPSTPEEFPLVVTLLRENIQDLHQDIRDLRSELKQDIQDVRSELHSVRSELSQDIQDVRSELKEDIGDLGAKMDARFARLNTTLIAVAGVVVAAVGALAAVLKV